MIVYLRPPRSRALRPAAVEPAQSRVKDDKIKNHYSKKKSVPKPDVGEIIKNLNELIKPNEYKM